MSSDTQDVGSGVQLRYWDPENEEFWNSKGKKIANRNLMISIPNLLLAFSVWIIFSIIGTYINDIHANNPTWYSFPDMSYSNAAEYGALILLLAATAGLSGATLRIPNSFMIAIAGGRNTKAMTALLLFIPMLLLGFALLDPNVPYTLLVLIALLVGAGGGAFSSSMSNISFFYPRKIQGTSLGLNAGLGNLGVSVMQLFIPIIVSIALFGALSGEMLTNKATSSVGVYIPNAAFMWVPIIAIFLVAAWFKMNNLPQHDVSDTRKAIGRFFFLELLGFLVAGLSTILLIFGYLQITKMYPDDKTTYSIIVVLLYFILVVFAISLTIFVLKKATNKETKERLEKQFKIFDNKHNWIMTWLYIMTFGSFIGFSQAFPSLIQVYFPTIDKYSFIWLGAFVGSIFRPVGGWLSDKFGGAKVTHYDTILMILSTVGVGIILGIAKVSDDPSPLFLPFLILFLLLFITTGIGNGSTFRMVPIIFEREQAGSVLGWTAAVAAYGAFIVPAIFAVALVTRLPDVAMYGFAIYYISCLFVNWYYYARKNAEMPC
jgi:NNP family nitrate/nitrite transporter-like MFS transporter